jgi:hypothetical protein
MLFWTKLWVRNRQDKIKVARKVGSTTGFDGQLRLH